MSRDRMSRVEDVSKAIDEIRNIDVTVNDNYRIAMIALLGHIAVALAVMADKMPDDKEK